MTEQLGQTGRMSVARCASICDACDARMVQPCVSFAGPNGYVTMCMFHFAHWHIEIVMPELEAIRDRLERERRS